MKDKKRDRRRRDGDLSPERSLKRGEVSKHQEALSLPGLWGVLVGVVLERRPQCAVSHEVRRRGQ